MKLFGNRVLLDFMTSPTLKNILGMLCRKLSDGSVPHALMGALALALYGIPRYTADIDKLSAHPHRKVIKQIMTEMDFACFRETEIFAQFDSDSSYMAKRILRMPDHSQNERLHSQRRLIIEMIEASMRLAMEKGAHPLTPGCSCIACVNKRKHKLSGPPKAWRHRL